MEQKLAELLASYYGITADAALQYVQASITEGSVDETDLEFLVGLYEIAVAGGSFPSPEVEQQFLAIDQGVSADVAVVSQATSGGRRQTLRQQFDEFVAQQFSSVTPEERAFLDDVFRQMYADFSTSGLDDAAFTQYFTDNLDRTINDVSITMADDQQRTADQAQQRMEDLWRGEALRLLQASAIPPEDILPLLNDVMDSLRGVQASGQSLEMGDGPEFAAARRLFTDTVLDAVDQYAVGPRGQEQAVAGTNVPQAPGGGPPTPTPQTIVPQGTQTAAFLQQAESGMTAAQAAQKQANQDPTANLIPELASFVNNASSPDLADYLIGQQDALQAEFKRSEARKAERFQSVIGSVGAAGATVGDGAFGGLENVQNALSPYQPSTFTDFLNRRVPELEASMPKVNRRRPSAPTFQRFG